MGTFWILVFIATILLGYIYITRVRWECDIMKSISIGNFDYKAIAGYPTNRATLLVSRNGLDLAASKAILRNNKYEIVNDNNEIVVIPSCIGKDIYDQYEAEWMRGFNTLVDAINI
jgi:hypothetical protein